MKFAVITVLSAVVSIVLGKSGSSEEHAIRAALLKDYDKTVRPAVGRYFPVEFGLKMNSLLDVNSKEGTITIKTWIVMRWNNSFFSWNTTKYKMKRVHFLPSEIWFPDIALYNNGDPDVPVAGGREKFLSNVLVNDQGECTWSGPASFTATCDFDIKSWPFDTQECDFEFGSFSYDSNQLTLTSFSQKSNEPKGNVNWEIKEVTSSISESDRGNCCPYKFSQLTYNIKLGRLYDYQMFYIFGPCLILTILALFSFWIPSESGERIGFVTTLMLSLMVYLLVVPDSLPVSSKEIPILGVVIMVTLVIISFILLATIVVLICFHCTGTPPAWLRIMKPKSTAPARTTPVHVAEMQLQGQSSSTLRAIQPNYLDGKMPTPKTQVPETPPPELDLSWQIISLKLDKIFFWVFFIIAIIVYAVLMAKR